MRFARANIGNINNSKATLRASFHFHFPYLCLCNHVCIYVCMYECVQYRHFRWLGSCTRKLVRHYLYASTLPMKSSTKIQQYSIDTTAAHAYCMRCTQIYALSTYSSYMNISVAIVDGNCCSRKFGINDFKKKLINWC